MKDLKENIQRNNIKKLVLSAVFGVFCYCTNNAMKKQIEIDDVNFTILSSQVRIYNASVPIQKYREKIYSTIKDEHGKVTKKNVLDFIKKQISTEEKTDEELKNDIKTIEQYFHLEEIKNDNDECNEKNLTETFWTETEAEDEKQEVITVEEKKPIKEYFNTIIKAENNLSRVFKSYYNEKKTKKDETTDEDILKEIMNDCCGEGEGDDKQTKFLNNLGKLCLEKSIGNDDSKITGKIKRRITLSNGTGEYENDFIYFLKQKIGEEKKEPVPPVKIPSVHTKKEECPCCC